MTNAEQLAEARKFLATPNLGKDMARELNKALAYIRELADVAEAAEARVKELEAGVAGQIVTASLENGKTRVECGLEDCECPEHDWPVPPAGTYITVRLDEDCQIGLFRVRVHTLPVESEGE